MEEPNPLEQKFQDALNRDDELGCVVRAHLHIEHLVDRLLEKHVPVPEALAKLHLEYSDKVTLLSAFGYLPKMTTPLSAIGSLRNAFAHRLDSAITGDRMDTLYKTFDGELKQTVQESYQRTRKQSGGVPKTMTNLAPKDRFVIYAISIRSMLVVSYKQHTGSYPE